MDNTPEIHISLSQIIGAIFTGIAGFAVWLLQKLGVRHIESIDNLTEEIRNLRKDVSKLESRVSVIEFASHVKRKEESS